ncbi:MAG: putative ABC transporter permease protein NosY [Anaerolineales bacterium]|nr:putative ABC transporter permease protein NosY [Anaerolineales bacterium]
MELRVITTLLQKEFRDSLRNRWFLLYTIAFGALSLGLSYFSLSGVGLYGFAGFGKTAASLINLVLLIVPLMALTIGAGSLAGEREHSTLSYLLAQPVNRTEVLLGKYLGLALALLASLGLGFGVSGIAIALRGGGTDAGSYVQIISLAYLLALTMLSLGFLISTLTSRTSVAAGIALFVWLGLVFFGDLGLMGTALVMKLEIGKLFTLALINPLQVFKMAAISGIHATLDVLGPAGVYAVRTYGDTLIVIFLAMMTIWIVLPLLASYAIFTTRTEV